jgi:hypothetical protein
MSSTLIVHCDICGQQVTSDRVLLKVASGPLRRRTHEIDLGPCCLPGLEALLGGQPAGLVVEALRGNGHARHPDGLTTETAGIDSEPEPERAARPRGRSRKGGEARP